MHLRWTPFAFRNPKSGSFTTPHTPCTKNEWSNFNKYVVVVEEERDENNIREFIKLIEQYEKTWKLARDELETINVGDKQVKREMKMRTFITLKKKRNDCPTIRIYKCFCLVLWGYVWFGYRYHSTQGTTCRKMQTGQTKVKENLPRCPGQSQGRN